MGAWQCAKCGMEIEHTGMPWEDAEVLAHVAMHRRISSDFGSRTNAESLFVWNQHNRARRMWQARQKRRAVRHVEANNLQVRSLW